MSRRAHKWLALIVAVQAVLWTLSGLYMTAIPIEFIHGDHLVRTGQASPVSAANLASPVSIAASIGAETVRLSFHPGAPVYIARTGAGDLLFDAQSGTRLPPPSRVEIERLAKRLFNDDGELVRLALIGDVPGEIRGRKPPLWRADFSGWNEPTLYLSPATGELVSRRHQAWRVFDFVWMLHIMDYDEREDVNNWLLRGFSLLALTTALFGVWLLWFAFPRRRRRIDAR